MEFDKSFSFIKYLYKNPLFGFALVIIFTALLVSILGANIRPDGTLPVSYTHLRAHET